MTTFIPNDEQDNCIARINQFIENNKSFSKMLINGSAGTGKTSILISSIINFINTQIMERYDFIKILIKENELKADNIDFINNFIIAAPTNKAKDVLVSKYNIYLNNLNLNSLANSITDRYVLNEITHRKIDFLTVSQVLSINRVINEMGEEEFTKGNEKKIADKYNKPSFNNTIIIVDECSMLDTNTTRLLNIIRCPIIYIGDYCQLPPVNEILSPIFNLEGDANIDIIRLTKVERCKNNITTVANLLRDKIYDLLPDFNLVRHNNIPDIVFYQKKMEKWLDVYVKDIKKKQKEIAGVKTNMIDTAETIEPAEPTDTTDSKAQQIVNDTMALAWTNKCCGMLNKKIRTKLFIDSINNSVCNGKTNENIIDDYDGIEDIDDHFLVKGDKLLVKAPYYKYDYRIYSSSIVYVADLKKVQYKPLSFREWCKLSMMILEDNAKPNSAIGNTVANGAGFDISLESILDEPQKTDAKANQKIKQKEKKSLLDYFDKDNQYQYQYQYGFNSNSNLTPEEKEKQEKLKQEKQLLEDRLIFYKYHNLQDVITADLYNFNDPISLKYNNVCNNICREPIVLEEIKLLPTPEQRLAKYKIWHREVSTILFGIPNDRVLCRKCQFFIKKFSAQIDKSCFVADMNDATENLKLDMYLTNLATLTTSSKYITNGIPILDMNIKSNIECIDNIKNIVRSSYEVKIILTKQDEHELKAINKMLNEDETSGSTTQKYITMSQMFGHYLSHIITSTYLEVDYGYALTVHKSQGSTYYDVFVEYGNLLANRKDTEKDKLLYTAVTRCENKLHVYY